MPSVIDIGSLIVRDPGIREGRHALLVQVSPLAGSHSGTILAYHRRRSSGSSAIFR
jgi:hypothetical protein